MFTVVFIKEDFSKNCINHSISTGKQSMAHLTKFYKDNYKVKNARVCVCMFVCVKSSTCRYNQLIIISNGIIRNFGFA